MKHLDGKVLKAILVALAEHTKLKVIAWGPDHGPENQGCKSKLLSNEKTFPWSFPHPSDPREAVLVILDSSHLIERNWAAMIGKFRKLLTRVGYTGLFG